jgi:ABC-type Zn uptake system ZnuABC Zn-binding protein ZnuA
MEYHLTRKLPPLLRLLLLPALITALLAACSSGGPDDGSKPRVLAATTQIGDFARNVGGDRIALTVLLKPNQDAHDFEPEPSQLRAIADADLVLRNGIGLDSFVSRALNSGGGKADVVVVSDNITLREGEEDHEEHGDDDEAHEEAGGHDPHVWFSVANARTMVTNVRDGLVSVDAANAGFYRDNAQRYLSELDALDAQIKARVAEIPSSCRKLVTNHDVLGYYSLAYGLELVGSVIPSTESNAQASAADVADIVGKIRAQRVPAIFAEASINPALIRQVGREANVKVVDDLFGDSLGPSGSDGDTYIKMMQADTNKIVDALKPCGA